MVSDQTSVNVVFQV